ncbi:MAG: hypothetical protein KTR19_02150, partial [Hyphomicrobiales bacterium]|nr:hypothetical protein [Hyphomicrobiales bacterium]
MVANHGEQTQKSRGIAFFLAYDPWQTCWKSPAGAVRYFDAAERQGLVTKKEKEHISELLIDLGLDVAKLYRGRFSYYFTEPRVDNILSNRNHLNHLSESGLAIADAWVDRLYEACPTPIVPETQLAVNSFKQVVAEGDIDFYSATPWLAWAEALDISCLGPWVGLQAYEIALMLNALRKRAIDHIRHSVDIRDDVLRHKVTIPIFSQSLQGFVSGVFYDVPKAQREPILTTLLQFGETMGDVYANLRKRHFIDALDEDLD